MTLEEAVERLGRSLEYADGYVAAFGEEAAWMANHPHQHTNIRKAFTLAMNAEAIRTVLAALPTREQAKSLAALVEDAHVSAVNKHPLFSSEHWEHNAGREWPHSPDDGSFEAFENCIHPACVAARALGRETETT